jgi:mannose-1-phosphate guanylyltransferase/mannose-6-phosphate isomerase
MYNFVVLCGGSGSRLWPKSREFMPKQFLKLTNDKTMLQNTVLRIKDVISSSNILDYNITIICNINHYYIVEQQVNELNLELNNNYIIKTTIITEPKGRDSAPAVCISSLLGDNNDYTFILPCDHEYDNKEFINCINKSFEYIDNNIITFGIKPTHIETGYGYIKTNNNLKTISFVEKPNYEIAKEYIEDGNYLWNAGIFGFKNSNMINYFEKYATDILELCKTSLEFSIYKDNILNLPKEYFNNCRSISVDYAIMENLCKNNENCITIPFNEYWNDIGSFSSLLNQYQKINNESLVIKCNHAITLDTDNCYIESYKPIVSTIGINNLIIIDTEDALLVCNNDNTQDVKNVVNQLKKTNSKEVLYHTKVYRPWGYYINVFEEKGFKIKKIAVYPGKRLSLQSHNRRSEHWVIVKGTGKVTLGEKEIVLNKDENVYIKVKEKHRIENIGNEILEFTETQIGDYLEEDDIIRYEDDFGRS